MAIASIERYWLVFHRRFYDKHILFFHYIPMTLCIIYPLVLYSYLVTRYPCTNVFNYSSQICGGPCYIYDVRYKFFVLRGFRETRCKRVSIFTSVEIDRC